jgi:hypothetical protein
VELHEKQYFEFLLNAAIERFSERLIQRNEGIDNGLAALRANPDGEGVWFSQFVDNFFEDMLLTNSASACLILQALEKRPVEQQQLDTLSTGKLKDILQTLAKQSFKKLLFVKLQESLEQTRAYGV